MSLIRRNWTPEAADNWSKEDWIAAFFSVAAYLLIAVGSTLSLLAQPAGYVLLFLGILSAGIMYYIIDPKLRAVSTDYESKQKEYLQHVEDLTRWEER
jgi:hypothetical protein